MNQKTPGTIKISAEEVDLPNGVHVDDTRYYTQHKDCCFGFIAPNHLYIGDTHHAKIIYQLIESGQHTYDSLMSAEQKWGWVRQNHYNNGELVISFTSDEASQTHDAALSEKVRQSFEQYFGTPSVIDPNVGEGWSNATEYGERSKEQYFGIREYCDYCNEYYDPEEESHNHYEGCPECGETYDPEDWYDSQEHHNPYCENCSEHYSPGDEDEHTHLPPAGSPKPGTAVWLTWNDGQVVKKYVQEADEWNVLIGDNPSGGPSQWLTWNNFNKRRQNGPSWLPEGLHMVPTQYKPSHVAISRNVDLHDARVFAILAQDYYTQIRKQGDVNTQQADPQVGEVWLERTGPEIPHTVTSITPGPTGEDMVSYSLPNGHGHMSLGAFKYYMRPAPEGFTYQNPLDNKPRADAWTEGDTDANNEIINPLIENTLQKDDPTLLAIERDSRSLEYRWSFDGTQLHIWRVINRWQYGPSHYDMFGSEGYSDHSQGRVYVSPTGKVGVLYWQISHPDCESTLNEWVEKEFGKDPDYVYRAYGPYKGYKTPRWDFPIVEVAGLPIPKSQRWWEAPGGKPEDAWYGYGNPYGDYGSKKKQKTYPAQKQKSKSPGPVDDSGSPVDPAKRQRRRQRRRKKQQYRNRRVR